MLPNATSPKNSATIATKATLQARINGAAPRRRRSGRTQPAPPGEPSRRRRACPGRLRPEAGRRTGRACASGRQSPAAAGTPSPRSPRRYVEGSGRSTRNAVRSQLQRIIDHALKLEDSAAPEPRAGWMSSIDEARDQIDNLLTPTLRRDLTDQLSYLFARTRRRVARDLRAHGEAEAGARCRRSAPMTLTNSSMRTGCRREGGGPRLCLARQRASQAVEWLGSSMRFSSWQ